MMKKTGPVDTVIQEITDEDDMLEDITIEPDSTVESLGSEDIGVPVVENETSGNKTNSNHMVGPSSHVHLDHNSFLCDFFNLMMSADFRSSIWQ